MIERNIPVSTIEILEPNGDALDIGFVASDDIADSVVESADLSISTDITLGGAEFIWDEEDDVELQKARRDAEQSVPADSVRAYLNEIGKVALLTAEDEVELSKQIEAGLYANYILANLAEGEIPVNASRRELRTIMVEGERAKEQLLSANLRLVVSIAKRYAGRSMPFLDIIQEGNLGLIRAVEKFDYTKGYKFSTYGTWWIRQAISRAMADQGRIIRLPVHMVEDVNKADRMRRELSVALGRVPTDAELAKELDITEARVQELHDYSRETLSLDMEVGSEGDSHLGDYLEDEANINTYDAVAYTLLQDQLKSVLQTLSEREAKVVKLRFGFGGARPRTLDEIGQELGVTRERIRQIESKTMAKLRHPSRSDVLRDYLR